MSYRWLSIRESGAFEAWAPLSAETLEDAKAEAGAFMPERIVLVGELLEGDVVGVVASRSVEGEWSDAPEPEEP